MSDGSETLSGVARTHQIWGWTGLLLFAGVGMTLEMLNGLKLGFYLDPDVALRREMWRLGHAHGTLLSLIQLAFAAALSHGWIASQSRARLASFFFRGALVLLPGGFLLGGLAPSESDPWIGVWLAPVGGAFLVLALGLAALDALQARS